VAPDRIQIGVQDAKPRCQLAWNCFAFHSDPGDAIASARSFCPGESFPTHSRSNSSSRIKLSASAAQTSQILAAWASEVSGSRLGTNSCAT
jgi:hypothetical protein